MEKLELGNVELELGAMGNGGWSKEILGKWEGYTIQWAETIDYYLSSKKIVQIKFKLSELSHIKKLVRFTMSL